MRTNFLRDICASLLLAVPAFASLLGGCGGASISDLCDRTCECETCDDAKRDQCVSSAEQFQKIADDAGCGDQFDDYLSCVDENLACSSGKAEVSGCAAQSEALDKCLPSTVDSTPSAGSTSGGG